MSALAVAIAVSAAVPSATAQPEQPYCGDGYGNGVMGFLTPDQRMMHFDEVQKAVANLSPNDMRTYRSQLHDTGMALMPLDRKRFADDLTAKWNALPPEQKAKIRQTFTTYKNDGRWGAMGMRQGKSMGGCWW
jgi:hypothetical protein